MKILVVNNGTKFLTELKNLLRRYNYKVVDSKNLTFKDTKGFDKIILTGGSRFRVKNHLAKYKKEISLIKNPKFRF